ncbi:natriuretic peptides A-like [Pantherophis guttatus]|uniref:Natriuretic peptides A-like n=1 Tax=Pantherophis guttatus TaxID=94885 RepID=A0A6P9B4Y2_PANGU|nr:natriuretic peptides A-like [Pantherophis guttatus]
MGFNRPKDIKIEGAEIDTTAGRGRRKTRVLVEKMMMGSRIPFLLSLFLTAHLQGPSGAQPISWSELTDFKDLLQRIESKVALAEKDEIERDPNDANEEPVGDAAQLLSSWDGDYSRPPSDGTNWQPPERAPAAAARNKLRGFFNAPRRLSSCFGQRLDRIGSVSGLGCNRRHK